MFCKNCGSELAEDSKFCSTCGAKVELETPFPAENKPITSRLETFDREDDKAEKSPIIDMDWDAPSEKQSEPYSSGVSFDWSSVSDEPRKRPVVNIRSPWDTKGLDDDEVDMIDRALSPAQDNDTLEDAVFRDAQESPAPERSRTLTFIDIVKARQQEEQAAHSVDTEFKADFGTAPKPFGAAEDFDFILSEEILPDKDREHTQGYTDLKNDIVAELEHQEPAQPQVSANRVDDTAILEKENPLEYTPNFEEQLEYIRARREAQQNADRAEQPAPFVAPQQDDANIFKFDEPIAPLTEELQVERPAFESSLFDSEEPQATRPAFENPEFDTPVFENPVFDGPAFEEPVAEAPAFTVPAIEVERAEVKPQQKDTLSLEEELANILGADSAFEEDNDNLFVSPQSTASQPASQQPLESQQVAPCVVPQDEEEIPFDIEDEYLNFAPTKRAARYESADDEMIAAGLASEWDYDTDDADDVVATESADSLDFEIAALQAQLEALKGKKNSEVEREPEVKIQEEPAIRGIAEEFTAEINVPVEDDYDYPNGASEEFDIDEILGKRKSIELDFSEEPPEIPNEWKERDFRLEEAPRVEEAPRFDEVPKFEETPKLEEAPIIEEAPKFEETPRFDDVDDASIEGELAALGFDIPAAKAPVEIADDAEVQTATERLFQETSAKYENLEKLINQELAVLGLKDSPGTTIPADDEMLFADDGGNMAGVIDDKPLTFEDIEQSVSDETPRQASQENVMTLDELEENLFADSTPEEDIEATRKIEKFFTLYRKNEEFQSLLDQEYEKLRGGADVATMLEAVDAYERSSEINGIPPEKVAPITTGDIRANIEKERAEFNAKQAQQAPVAQQAQQTIVVPEAQAAPQAPAADQVIAPPVMVEEEPEKAPTKEKGGALTVIAIIVAILLALLFVIILILNFAPDSAVAIKVSEWIGKFASTGAIPGIGEWLV